MKRTPPNPPLASSSRSYNRGSTVSSGSSSPSRRTVRISTRSQEVEIVEEEIAKPGERLEDIKNEIVSYKHEAMPAGKSFKGVAIASSSVVFLIVFYGFYLLASIPPKEATDLATAMGILLDHLQPVAKLAIGAGGSAVALGVIYKAWKRRR